MMTTEYKDAASSLHPSPGPCHSFCPLATEALHHETMGNFQHYAEDVPVETMLMYADEDVL